MIKKTMVVAVSFSILIILLAYGVTYYKSTHKVQAKRATPSVDVYTVKSQTWQQTTSSVGTLVANQGVILKSQVSAPVKSLHFISGQAVDQGDLLIELQNESEYGAYQTAKANYDLSVLTYKRYKKLLKFKAVSQDDVDTKLADSKANKGLYLEALAAYNKTLVVAPFSGILGLSNLHLGQYISVGDELVSLQSIDSLYVNFTLPEKYKSLLHVGESVTITPDTVKQTSIQGTVVAMESLIDTDTGSLSVRAQIPNDDHSLTPGGFVKVLVPLGEKQSLITVPQVAVGYDQDTSYVFVVNGDQVALQNVTIGAQVDQDISITSGLKVGDVIVSNGVNKLHDGSKIIAVSSETTNADAGDTTSNNKDNTNSKDSKDTKNKKGKQGGKSSKDNKSSHDKNTVKTQKG